MKQQRLGVLRILFTNFNAMLFMWNNIVYQEFYFLSNQTSVETPYQETRGYCRFPQFCYYHEIHQRCSSNSSDALFLIPSICYRNPTIQNTLIYWYASRISRYIVKIRKKEERKLRNVKHLIGLLTLWNEVNETSLADRRRYVKRFCDPLIEIGLCSAKTKLSRVFQS